MNNFFIDKSIGIKCGLNGAHARIRTADLLITNQYQCINMLNKKNWTAAELHFLLIIAPLIASNSPLASDMV